MLFHTRFYKRPSLFAFFLAAAFCLITLFPHPVCAAAGKGNNISVSLNRTAVTLEHGEIFALKATVTGSSKSPTFKSSKSSVAIVSESGRICGQKPGTADITVRSGKATAICHVTVKKPSVQLNKQRLTLYRNGRARILATVSSGLHPTWKSSNSSIAQVNEYGIVIARRHGTATIRATIDGVTRCCQVIVKSPVIALNKTAIQLKPDHTCQLKAVVSSGQKPSFRTSSARIATVDSEGYITAYRCGTTYITVSEDGTSVRCKITVAK